MLTIRLQRTGKKNQAQFRIVLAEKESHVSKKFQEVLGSYNPHKKSFKLANQERLNYWIAQRVELSPTVHNLLVTQGLLKAGKTKSFNIPKKKEEQAAEAAAATTEATTEAAKESPATESTKEIPAEKSEEPAPEQPAV